MTFSTKTHADGRTILHIDMDNKTNDWHEFVLSDGELAQLAQVIDVVRNLKAQNQ